MFRRRKTCFALFSRRNLITACCSANVESVLPLRNCSIYPAYLQHTCSILLQYISSIVAALLQSCCNDFAIQFQCKQHDCSMFQICKLCCKYAANMQISICFNAAYASMQHMLQNTEMQHTHPISMLEIYCSIYAV